MRPIHAISASLLAILLAAGSAGAQTGATSSTLRWGPAPPQFPAGARMAVLAGNPAANEVFTIRLRMPDGYQIAPHTHPTDEFVTVIQGSLSYGMGGTTDPRSMRSLPVGGFVALPREHPHYVRARGETIVQVHALGPFSLTYVNPADDPTRVSSH
jgi:quercetin dioxygenase-like cupin family protein